MSLPLQQMMQQQWPSPSPITVAALFFPTAKTLTTLALCSHSLILCEPVCFYNHIYLAAQCQMVECLIAFLQVCMPPPPLTLQPLAV